MMRHYVQYHSVEKMGGPPRELFRVFTDKPVDDDIVGSRIWLIVGERGGSGKQYSLHSTFSAEVVHETDDPRFHSEVRAESGTHFDPAPDIEEEYWLDELLQRTGNFAFGLTDVTDRNRIVGGLRTLGRSCGADC